MSRGEKTVKKKMKIKTQNEKIVETDEDIGTKKVIRVRKKKSNVSSSMNHL